MMFNWGDDELQLLLETIKHFLLGINVFLLLTAALVFCAPLVDLNSATLLAAPQLKRALIVTAHPDDESMFFLPLMHSLQQQSKDPNNKWQTHLLCLSRGNFDGLGHVRVKELEACATYIGLATDRVSILDDPTLQDGIKNYWNIAHIATIVTEYILKHKIDAVFTFDNYGVSGHANHIATHDGVKQAVRELNHTCAKAESETTTVRGWALESTNIVRKYVGLLDTALSYWHSRHQENDEKERPFVFIFRPRWNYNAMAMHQSQFVWYRRLFVIFSRYTFINTFRPILSVDTATRRTAEQKKVQ